MCFRMKISNKRDYSDSCSVIISLTQKVKKICQKEGQVGLGPESQNNFLNDESLHM